MKKILATRKFVGLYALAAFHLFAGYYFNNSYKQIGLNGGLPDSTLTYIGSMGSLMNGVCKLVLAAFLDFMRFKPIYLVIVSIQIIDLIVIPFSVTRAPMFGLCVIINFMCDGSMTSMLPAVTLDLFGVTRGA